MFGEVEKSGPCRKLSYHSKHNILLTNCADYSVERHPLVTISATCMAPKDGKNRSLIPWANSLRGCIVSRKSFSAYTPELTT